METGSFSIALIVFGTSMLLMFVTIITSFMIIHRQKQKRNRLELKEAEYHYKNQLLQTRLEVEELALKNISTEIHDNVNQVLSMVRMQLFNATLKKTKGETDSLVEESNRLLKGAIDILRNLSHTRNGSGITKMGLITAIRKEIATLMLHGGLKIDFICADEDLPISGESEILIFRIIQEALSNIMKHAKATEVTIEIKHTEDYLNFFIIDNGIGMPPAQNRKFDGIGLINMHERANILKGTIEIQSGPSRGSAVKLKMPLL